MHTSVRDLQIGEMISISAGWVGANKATFLAIPQIAPLHARVEAVHGALIAARDGATANATLTTLAAKADALDHRHDDLSRALYYLLYAAKYFEMGREGGDDALAATLDRCGDKLFPQGLRGILASYQAEAGNAAQLNQLATTEFAAVLGNVYITKTQTALDIAQAIGTVGAELGSVEQQRAMAAVDAKNETIGPAEVRKRMREWAQVAEAVLVNLELTSAPPPDLAVLRQPLLDAANKALERRREKRAKREEAAGKEP